MADILEDEMQKGKFKGVLHCFSSGAELAQRALNIGFYISFSGILTFNKSEDLREIAKDVPLDRLLVETDSPYLATPPHRGKTNEPAYVAHTAKFLAELRQTPVETLRQETADNFIRLFGCGV